MATERAKTNIEAQRRITEQMDAVRPLLRKAMQSNDKAAIEKYSNEMTRLDRLMRATATITVGGVDVPIGAIGSGLQSGISGLFTAIPDIAVAGYNYLKPEPDKILSGLITGQQPQKQETPSLSDLGTKYLGIQNEPMSDEQAYAFRMSQGAGSAAIPSAGTKGLLLGTGLGAADVAVSQATGTPEGLASGLYAIGNLTRAGFKGIQGLRESRKLNKFIEENVPLEGQNVFRQFMLRGQGSDSPIVAAAIQKLRSQPEYAELFAKFDKAATDLATEGMRPSGRSALGKGEEVAQTLAERIAGQADELKIKRSQAGDRQFEVAFQYGQERGIIDPTNLFDKIAELKKQFEVSNTDSAKAAVKYLDELQIKVAVNLRPNDKMDVRSVQARMSEFGKQASLGESLIKDLSISDEQRMFSALFGATTNDLKASRLAAKSVEDKAATGVLLLARKNISDASDKYNEFMSKGIPSFIKDKSLQSIEYPELYSAYQKLTPEQQILFRKTVENTNKEALNFIDKNVFDDFINKAKGENNAGVFTTDLEKLAKNWATLKDNQKTALTSALGANAAEFDQRMKDALVFTRRMRVSQPAAEAEKVIASDLQRGVSGVVGAGAGYAPAKAVDVAMTTFNELFKRQGLTDEQLMKMLLTPEGADFLRQGSLTGASRNTLDALTKIPSKLEATAPALSAISRLTTQPQPVEQTAPAAPVAPTQIAPEGVFVPEDIFTNQPMEQQPAPAVTPTIGGEVFVPEDIFTSGATTSPRVDVNANKDERQGIFSQELGQLIQRSNAAQASGDQGAFQRVTGDINALLREAQRNNLQLSVQ